MARENAVMRSVVAMSGTPMCAIGIPLTTRNAAVAASTRPPQPVTIAWKDSRAIASVWRARVAAPNVRRTRAAR